jgi:hypothetical protein
MFHTAFKSDNVSSDFRFGNVIKKPKYEKDETGWNIMHIGCKWDAVNAECMLRENNMLAYDFKTPWSPPIPGVTEISSMFPDLTFTLTYHECGMAFGGKIIIKDRKVVKHNHLDDSKKASRYMNEERRNV